jgi:hypothetical protein
MPAHSKAWRQVEWLMEKPSILNWGAYQGHESATICFSDHVTKLSRQMTSVITTANGRASWDGFMERQPSPVKRLPVVLPRRGQQ